MPRQRFPISSDLLELLLAFEGVGNLRALSEAVARDPSVISRNLQRLAAELPVLTKSKGRWRLSPLGREINSLTREYLARLSQCIGERGAPVASPIEPYQTDRALLMVINAQAALQSPTLGRRNNSDAEGNIRKLLSHWRLGNRPIAHVRHVSDDRASMFFRGSKGASFIPLLSPSEGELVFEKSKASAFSGTSLARELGEREIVTVVITGFTGNECIDATAKQASDLGFTVYVVADATATFDVSGPDGTIHKAERVHRLVLANLHALFGRVIETRALLAPLA